MPKVSYVSEWDFAGQYFNYAYNVGIGDQTIMVGLFADHSGTQKNVPVGRGGFIAAMPDDTIPVKLAINDSNACPSYLNDMRSRDGFSGSPVWVWRTPYDDMNPFGMNGPVQAFNPKNVFLRLLGVHRGQFREKTEIELSSRTEAMQREPLRSGDKIEIASAMTVVIPAWKITELLDYPKLVAQRSHRDLRPDRIRLAEDVTLLRRALE